MRTGANIKRIILISLIAGAYISVIKLGNTESTRRSLFLEDETGVPDRVLITVVVTNVAPSSHELTTQLDFRLFGNISKDNVTPSVDLKLLTNNIDGQQEFDFPKGRRISPIQVVVPLDGETNKYPFDRYEAALWFFMTTPAPKRSSPVPEATVTTEQAQTGQLVLGTAALQNRRPISASLSLSAAIPGIRFRGSVNRDPATERSGVELQLRHSNNLIGVSVLVNVIMLCLALSVLGIALRLVGSESKGTAIAPLSLAVSLIFGLPALRSVQPSVPPVGAFCDYASFIWAELIVAISAMIVAWIWILGHQNSPEKKAD